MARRALHDELNDALLELCAKTKEETEYDPVQFRRMVVEDGGLEVARRLLGSPTEASGLTRLWDEGRLDLSLENLVLQDPWRELFTDEERSVARSRLERLGFPPAEPPAAPPERSRGRFDRRFRAGLTYTRDDVYRILDVPRDQRGGDWNTGYHSHAGEWFIFATVGSAARTGHNYENEWSDQRLVWRGKTDSNLNQPSIQDMLNPDTPVHVFTRSSARDPFTYQGVGTPVDTAATIPVTITWAFDDPRDDVGTLVPGEASATFSGAEGGVMRVTVDRYERSRGARDACIRHWGTRCVVCGMDFGEVYGELGAGYVHVHHLTPLSELAGSHEVDPVKDLRPVCPNCHAMIHRGRTTRAPEEVAKHLTTKA